MEIDDIENDDEFEIALAQEYCDIAYSIVELKAQRLEKNHDIINDLLKKRLLLLDDLLEAHRSVEGNAAELMFYSDASELPDDNNTYH